MGSSTLAEARTFGFDLCCSGQKLADAKSSIRRQISALLSSPGQPCLVDGLSTSRRRYGSMYVDTDVVILQDPLAPRYVQTSYDVQVTAPRGP